MSTTQVELPLIDTKNAIEEKDLIVKNIESSPLSSSAYDSTASSSLLSSPSSPSADKLKHNKKKKEKNHHNTSIHQYDSKVMSGFYEACVEKLQEVYPSWSDSWHLKENPLFMSNKHAVHDRVIKFIQENQEQAIVLQNFDYGDILNFERFLQALKQDGVNSISKYKQYLINKDMKKLDLDLVIIHAKYGILLVDIKECDYLDSKRRSKAKVNLGNARQIIENLVKLITEAKGLSHESKTDNSVPISEIVALPNIRERPQQQPQQPQKSQKSNSQINYLIKSDLETSENFKSWWSTSIVERLETRKISDTTVLNNLIGMFSCIRNNSIVPIVRKELDVSPKEIKKSLSTLIEKKEPIAQEAVEVVKTEEPKELPVVEEELYRLSVSGEFFHDKHEKVRSLSRVIVASRDEDRIKRTVCMQILWLLLNDSQKKICVVCSEKNKAYYEEYFNLQRKLYNNLNNVRFYSDLQSCPINGTSHTLRIDGEIWFFDCDLAMSSTQSEDIIARIKELNAFWVYTQDVQWTTACKANLDLIQNLNYINLDPEEIQVQHKDGSVVTHVEINNKPWVSGLHLKFPLRLQCDLLVIGDVVTSTQLKYLLRYFKIGTTTTTNGQSAQSQASKRIKTIKFIRGGTIDNIRTSLKMHDSIQAQFVLMHVGDEDVFKTRNSQTTIDRIKELTQLVKEYCPKSFIVLSTLMRRASKSENNVINEINKGIIQFCKQARDSSNFYYMLNNHFDPEYHTHEGRVLSNKGLKLYVDNILFIIDYFLVIKNNKQH